MNNKKLSLVGCISITIAFFASVRTVPNVAATGWASIVYMLIAGLMFALPIALISAELSTMWTDEGGSHLWVSHGLGNLWGFITPWLLWIMMFFAMLTLCSTFSIMLADFLQIPFFKTGLGVFLTTVCLYWLVTFLSIKFNMLSVLGGIGTYVGVYIPFIIVIILGILFFFKHGINPDGYLAGFTPGKLLPDVSNLGALPVFIGIIFIFAGVEMSSVHVNEIENPSKNFPIAVVTAVVLVVVAEIVAGLGMANAVPNGQIELSNVMQGVGLAIDDLGLPKIIGKVMDFCILTGLFVQLLAWALGPSKSLLSVAHEGRFPEFFQKTDKRGNPIAFMLVQATVISIFAVLFLIPGIDVDAIFLLVTVTSTLLYCVVYLLIIISAIRLRYTSPNLKPTFRLGKKGNTALWVIGGASIFSIVLVIFVSMIPPDSFPESMHVPYVLFQIIAVFIAIFSGAYIFLHRKPHWKKSALSKGNLPQD